MEYVQEQVTTLHDVTDPNPDPPTDRVAVVVPMTQREYADLAVERVLSELEAVAPARVLVPLHASADDVGTIRDWLETFDLPLSVVWCDGPRLESVLSEGDLTGQRGKGRDVWLALGVALDHDVEFVVLHDADVATYSRRYVSRLLFPLAHGYEFSKGYYARVENDRLYGRLFRLFYRPLVRALEEAHDAPILDYLESFRYALAGEFAGTRELISTLRIPRSWGLEVGTLGDAFDAAGFDDTAQVDLGTYEHDHRSVGGPTGLSDMSRPVGRTLLQVVTDHGVDPEYDRLSDRYRDAARRLVRQYEMDAAFNGLSYDRTNEIEQVEAYAEAIAPPSTDDRLPAWETDPIDPGTVRQAVAEDLEAVE